MSTVITVSVPPMINSTYSLSALGTARQPSVPAHYSPLRSGIVYGSRFPGHIYSHICMNVNWMLGPDSDPPPQVPDLANSVGILLHIPDSPLVLGMGLWVPDPGFVSLSLE